MRWLPKSGSTESIFKRKKASPFKHVMSSLPPLVDASSSEASSYDEHDEHTAGSLTKYPRKREQQRSSVTRTDISSEKSLDKRMRKRTRTYESPVSTSPTVKFFVAIILLTAAFRKTFFLHGISLIILKELASIWCAWVAFYSHHLQMGICFRTVSAFSRRVRKESEKAVGGNYGSQVAAAYLYYNCTAPGESYVSYVMRLRMSCVNYQVIDEIREWRERRLGYQKSQRQILS